MRNDRGLDSAALDRHITGDFGEKQFTPEIAPPGKEWVCAMCGRHDADLGKLENADFDCAGEAVLCPLGSDKSKEFDAICGLAETEQEGPYTVTIQKPGCEHCGAGKTYDVVFHDGQPDELAESTSYDDYDHACDVRDWMNRAYRAGAKAAQNQCLLAANGLLNMNASLPMSEVVRDMLREHAEDLQQAGLGKNPRNKPADIGKP